MSAPRRHQRLPAAQRQAQKRDASCGGRRLNTPCYLTAAITFDDGDIVLRLQIHPELRTIAEVSSKPHGSVRADRPAAVQNIGDATGGYTNRDRETVSTQSSGGKLPFQKAARMGNWRHMLSLMIIDDLDVVGITSMELEADAPTGIDGDCPLTSTITL